MTDMHDSYESARLAGECDPDYDESDEAREAEAAELTLILEELAENKEDL